MVGESNRLTYYCCCYCYCCGLGSSKSKRLRFCFGGMFTVATGFLLLTLKLINYAIPVDGVCDLVVKPPNNEFASIYFSLA